MRVPISCISTVALIESLASCRCASHQVSCALSISSTSTGTRSSAVSVVAPAWQKRSTACLMRRICSGVNLIGRVKSTERTRLARWQRRASAPAARRDRRPRTARRSSRWRGSGRSSRSPDSQPHQQLVDAVLARHEQERERAGLLLDDQVGVHQQRRVAARGAGGERRRDDRARACPSRCAAGRARTRARSSIRVLRRTRSRGCCRPRRRPSDRRRCRPRRRAAGRPSARRPRTAASARARGTRRRAAS